MKLLILFIGFLTILVSCSKKAENLGADYDNFVGVWQEQDGDASSSYEFKKNGKIIFKQGIDRGYSIKIDHFILVQTDPINGWKRYAVEYKKSIYYHLSYSISPTNDTIWAAGTFLDSNSVQQQTKEYYTRLQ